MIAEEYQKEIIDTINELGGDKQTLNGNGRRKSPLFGHNLAKTRNLSFNFKESHDNEILLDPQSDEIHNDLFSANFNQEKSSQIRLNKVQNAPEICCA